MHAPAPEHVRRVRPEPRFPEFVVLVAMMMAITAFSVDNLLPAFPAIGGSFRVTNPNDLQLLVYVYMLGFGSAQIVYGPVADVVGRRPSYLAGLAIFLVGTVLAMLAQDLGSLLLARFIQGTGAASGRVLAVTIVRDRFAGREMARVMSLTMTVFIMVPIFAPAIGSLVLAFGDWHWIFALSLLLGVGLGIWFILRMPETLRPENRMPFSAARLAEGARVTATSRVAFGYTTAGALLFGCIMAMVGSAQQIFAEAYGLGGLFPLVFGALAASIGAASLVNSRIVRRFGMHRLSHGAVMAFLVCAILQAGLAVASAGKPPLAAFGIILALSQFFSGLAFPNFNALAMEPLGRVAGTASSLIGVYSTVLAALCGYVIGGAYDGTVLPLSVGYVALGSLAFMAVVWTERGRLFHPIHPDPGASGRSEEPGP